MGISPWSDCWLILTVSLKSWCGFFTKMTLVGDKKTRWDRQKPGENGVVPMLLRRASHTLPRRDTRSFEDTYFYSSNTGFKIFLTFRIDGEWWCKCCNPHQKIVFFCAWKTWIRCTKHNFYPLLWGDNANNLGFKDILYRAFITKKIKFLGFFSSAWHEF